MLIKRPVSEVFPFFEDAHNLSTITPPWLNFQILSQGKIAMQPGAEIEYRIRMLGIPMYWKTVIAEYQPPFGFVDEQETGPYRRWHHSHSFREVPEGTLASDDVEYSLPLGPLGRVAHLVMVRHQLIAIFRYRQAALRKAFGGQAATVRDPAIVLKTP
jgi:ligand-binding SRPBCC domain-containing protein